MSKNTALTYLYCDMNQLTELDVSKNINLVQLEFWSNDLRLIDLSHNTALKVLNCGRNQLIAIDVSKNELNRLYCHNNHLTVLDLGSNKNFFEVNCDSQTASLLNITSTGDSSYPYQFSFTDIMTSAQTANVSSVQGLDATSRDIATIYSNGVAKFASSPAKVTYNYATGYGTTKMDVTLTEGSDSAQVKSVITTASLPDGNTGTPYTQTLTASGSAPITWTRSAGKLPDGLTLSSAAQSQELRQKQERSNSP